MSGNFAVLVYAGGKVYCLLDAIRTKALFYDVDNGMVSSYAQILNELSEYKEMQRVFVNFRR